MIADDILLWKHVESERCQYYKDMLNELLLLGYKVNAVTMDGKRGLSTVFKGYPIQTCHFHQKQTVQRYITKKPKLQASKDLQTIMRSLTKVSEKTFKLKLDNWHNKYEDFLSEYAVNLETGEVVYTHKKLRAAYASLCSNFDYLFTYKKFKEFNIPNTTNHLDGGKFADMKNRIRVHRGLSKEMKKKVVDYYAINNGKK